MIGAGLRIGGGQAEVSREHKAMVAKTASMTTTQQAAEEKELARRHMRRLIGDSSFVFYAILLSLNAFLIKRLLANVTWDVILLCNYSFRVGVFIVLALLWHDLPQAHRIFAAQPMVLMKLFSAGAILTLQMTIYYQTLKMIPVWAVKTFMMCGPVFYFVVEWLAFGKAPSSDVYVGAFLVLAGALYILLTDPLFRKAPPEVVAS